MQSPWMLSIRELVRHMSLNMCCCYLYDNGIFKTERVIVDALPVHRTIILDESMKKRALFIPELVHEIFLYLSPQDIQAISRTSKRYREMVWRVKGEDWEVLTTKGLTTDSVAALGMIDAVIRAAECGSIEYVERAIRGTIITQEAIIAGAKNGRTGLVNHLLKKYRSVIENPWTFKEIGERGIRIDAGVMKNADTGYYLAGLLVGRHSDIAKEYVGGDLRESLSSRDMDKIIREYEVEELEQVASMFLMREAETERIKLHISLGKLRRGESTTVSISPHTLEGHDEDIVMLLQHLERSPVEVELTGFEAGLFYEGIVNLFKIQPHVDEWIFKKTLFLVLAGGEKCERGGFRSFMSIVDEIATYSDTPLLMDLRKALIGYPKYQEYIDMLSNTV